MGFFSSVDKAARNVLETKDSDEMMEKYVGENPYIYKNYNAIWAASQEFQSRLVNDGGAPLSTEERAMFRLAIISVMAHNIRNFPLREKYIDAARRVEKDHGKKIRTTVSAECDRLCRRVGSNA